MPAALAQDLLHHPGALRSTESQVELTAQFGQIGDEASFDGQRGSITDSTACANAPHWVRW